MERFIEILFYFIVYSFLGWILESVYKSIYEINLVNSGFLHGPFCPIYGIGALIMFFSLKSFTENILAVFCLGFVVLSIWEYLVSVLLEKIFHTKYWDYSNNKYNLQGRVCLLNSVFWGILGVVFIYIIHPFIQDKLQLIDINIVLHIDIVVALYLIVDCIISAIKITNIEANFKTLEKLNETIKEKLEEIKKKGKTNIADSSSKIIDELKARQKKLYKRLYRSMYRLKKAFPTMQSDKISKILELKNKQKEK